MTNLANNLTALKIRIQNCCHTLNLDPLTIKIIAVSKRQSEQAIRAAYALGIRDFAENYVQEYLRKQENLKDLSDIQWHLIGHIQSNKIKELGETNIALIHSLDSLKLAQKISAHFAQKNKTVAALIQLRLDNKSQAKTGASLPEAQDIARFLRTQKHISWKGFMGIGAPDLTPQETLQDFQDFAQQARVLWQEFSPTSSSPLLSLGMSGDLELALQAGSTMVRVGTALFGEREK